MEHRVEAIPDHWMIFVGDPDGEIPTDMGPNRIAATRSCVAVGTEYDEEATIVLSDSRPGLGLGGGPPVFESVLATPSRKLVISDAAAEVLLEIDVATDRTRIQIWTNHPTEPDKVAIVARPE
jgi:hypothetical protein